MEDAKFSRQMEGWKWYRDNFDMIRKEYANRWVAIFDGSVVYSGDDRYNVLREASRTKRVALKDIFVEYVDTDISILAA